MEIVIAPQTYTIVQFSFHFRAIFHSRFHSSFFLYNRISFATAERLRQRIYIQLFHGTSDLFWMWRPAPQIADRYEDEAEKEREGEWERVIEDI